MHKVKFSYSEVYCDREHYINENDIEIVLERLPCETWQHLKAVHFNDRGRGVRVLGYTNRSRREIAICALPPRVSLTRFLLRRYKQTPLHFGAARGRQWPRLAVRRFLLYGVFLHELGHLQIIDENTKKQRRKFAGEHKAEEFAVYWRNKLWSRKFSHPDPVHNAPSKEEVVRI